VLPPAAAGCRPVAAAFPVFYSAISVLNNTKGVKKPMIDAEWGGVFSLDPSVAPWHFA
jgi:hypothetical protein